MNDSRSKLIPPNLSLIDINNPHDVRNWSQTFGVTPKRLKEVVDLVGDSSDHVRKYICRHARYRRPESAARHTGWRPVHSR